MRKSRIIAVVFIALSLVLSAPAWAGQGITVTGKAHDQLGNPIEGLLISDENSVAISGADGKFSIETERGRLIWYAAPNGFALQGHWWLTADEAAQKGQAITLEKAETELPLRIALLADPHLFDYTTIPSYYNLGRKAAAKPLLAWEAAVRQATESHPHLTIVLGDLCYDVDKGSKERSEAQMKIGAMAASLLPKPWRAIPGNHDVRYDSGSVDYSLWRKHMGPMRHVFKLGGVAFIMLDNVALGRKPGGKPKNCGGMSQETLQWLQNVVKVFPPEMPVILCTHFPLASAVTGANPLHGSSLVQAEGKPGYGLRDVDKNAQKALEILMERKVCVLISGHEHAFHYGWLKPKEGPLQLLAVPALCGAWWSGDRQWGPLQFDQGWIQAEVFKTRYGVEIKPYLRATDPPVNVRAD